jgi:hypothetical protein
MEYGSGELFERPLPSPCSQGYPPVLSLVGADGRLPGLTVWGECPGSTA